MAACADQALGWVRTWWDEAISGLDEPPPVRELVADNAVHYAVWHAVGPTTGSQPGFLALHRFAIREAQNLQKRRTRRQRKEVVVSEFPPIPDSQPTEDQTAISRQIHEQLELLIALLPDRYRLPLLLHFFHDW